MTLCCAFVQVTRVDLDVTVLFQTPSASPMSSLPPSTCGPTRTYTSTLSTPGYVHCISSSCEYKSKVKAVSSLQDHSKHFTLYFPDRPVHSDIISASLRSIQPYATINARRLLIHISTTVYSQVLIYTAE